MHLLGRFTNPSEPLKAIFKALPDEPIKPSEQPSEPPPVVGRLRSGEVKRAVGKALAAAKGPLSIADIHRGVERMLGHPVSKDSVGWCLAAGARGKAPRFERTSIGRYRLRATE